MSPDSTVLWTQTKNGSGNGDDYVYAITIDRSTSGASNPSAVNIYVTGSTATSNGDDCTTIKITNSGTISWTATYNGSANSTDIGRDIIVDASGNVYVTGECTNTGAGKDMLTIKYNSSGTQQWTATLNKINFDEAGNAMCFDGSGNIIVGGYKSASSTNKDAMTVKYTTSGTRSWDASYAGTSNLHDWANDVTVNGDDVYITGKTTSSTSAGNYLTVKYNSSGTQQWAATYDGAPRDEDESFSIVYSASNIYITGKSKGTTSSVTTYDYATIKYNTSGTAQWTVRYNGASNGDDIAGKIIVDFKGDLIVTGTSVDATSGTDYYTICYNTSGTSQWALRYANPSYNGSDYATGIASDVYGNIYVTGTSAYSSTYNKFCTVKYTDNTRSHLKIKH